MIEKTSPTVLRERRPPLGLLGALVLILGVEWFVARHKADVMGASLKSVDRTREIAARKVRDCELMAFGDSMVKHSLSPKVIKNRTGLKGYNFALAGTQAPASFFLFREALASGARPKVVLVDFFPELLTTDPWVNYTHWPVLGSYRDFFDLAWYSGDPSLFASMTARGTLPSMRCRESIRAAILEAFQGQAGVTRTNNRIAEHFWETNRGFEGTTPLADQNLSADYWIGRYFQSIECTPTNRYFVDRFMELAAEHGVKVCLLLPPYMPHLQAKVEEVGFHAKHDAWVRSLLDRHPNLDVLDARKSNYDQSAFRDVNHLASQGAFVFSDDIGEMVRRKLEDPGSVPRWVHLPAYRPRSIDAKYASHDESIKVVLKQIEDEKKRR